MAANMRQRFSSFREFYPYYLAEHSNRWNRRIHFGGKVALLLILAFFLVTFQWWLLVAVPVVGYAVSWAGHFWVEGNRPAAFGHPLYSFWGDLVMCKDMLTGKVAF